MYSQEDICITWIYKEGQIMYVLPFLFCSTWQVSNWAPSLPQSCFSDTKAVKLNPPVTPMEITCKDLSYCSQNWLSLHPSYQKIMKGFITRFNFITSDFWPVATPNRYHYLRRGIHSLLHPLPLKYVLCCSSAKFTQ